MIPRVRVLLVVVAVLCGLLAAGPSGAVDAPARAPKPPKPTVTVIKPSSGPVAGGTKVVVKGKNLTGAKKVLFGKVKGTKLTVKSAKKLTVVAPPHAKGKVHVRVVTKGGKSKSTSADFFTYLAPPPPPPPASPPSVTGVTPGSGSTAGGTLVTVSGTHLTGATSVTFGGTPGTGLTPVSATTLKVTSPAHAAGPVDVRVTTAAGTSPVVAAGTFSYQTPAPAVTAIAPTAGPIAGGTEVTVTGTAFTGTTSVTFGDTDGTEITVSSDTSLTVISPAGAAGTVDVRVTTTVGTSAVVAADKFEYLAPGDPPTVTAVSPSSGPTSGGTEVTVTGTDFAGATSVTFGGTEGTGLVVSTDTSLTVVSPSHGPGVVDVRVETADGVSEVVPADEFTYVAGASEARAYAAPLPGDADEDPGASLNAVSCPEAQSCVAVGSYLSGGLRAPLIEVRTGNDSWDFFRPDLPADAATDVEVDLADVDCATPTFCVAIGTYVDDSPEPLYLPLIETWDGDVWTSSSPALPGDSGFTEDVLLSDVDCPAVDICVAVGRYDEDVDGNDVPLVLAMTGGTWSSPAVAVPAGSTGKLNAVACPTAGACIAVGEETKSTGEVEPLVVTGPGPWTVNTSVGLPADADADDPQTLLNDVSCSAAGACVAAGSYLATTDTSRVQGLLEVLASTTWTPVSVTVPWEPAPNSPATNPRMALTSVSCASTCAAVGDYRVSGTGNTVRPVLVRVNGTTATAERGAVPDDADGAPIGSEMTVTCAAGNRCLGVGYYQVDPGLSAPLLSGLNAGVWTPDVGPRPDDLSDTGRPLASALDGSAVVSVGYYVDLNGFTQALLMLDLPL